MSEPEGFEVRLGLASPIALGALPYAPTLDAVIMGLLSGGDTLTGEEADRMLTRLASCVDVDDSIPSASALWPTAPGVDRLVDIRPRDPSPSDVMAWAKRVQYRTDSGKYTPKMSSRQLLYSPQWSWWGEGNIEVLSEVLADVTSVGARRGSGYGAVVEVDIVRDTECSWRLDGFEAGEVILSRPVPLRSLESYVAAGGFGVGDLHPERHAIVPLPVWPRPPWGDGPSEPTVVPILAELG